MSLGILCVLLGDFINDRSYQVRIMQPVKMYADCETAGLLFSKPLGEATPEMQAKVLRICYSKDFRVAKIRLENGMEGWVVDGLGIKLTK